jgi:hypothetical protein
MPSDGKTRKKMQRKELGKGEHGEKKRETQSGFTHITSDSSFSGEL